MEGLSRHSVSHFSFSKPRYATTSNQLIYAIAHRTPIPHPLTSLLSRGNKLALDPYVVCPSASQSWATSLLRKVLHALFQLRPEVSNETLDGPSESLTESCTRDVSVIHSQSDDNDPSNGKGPNIPQMVWPSTCFVNSCSISISRSRPCPLWNRSMI